MKKKRMSDEELAREAARWTTQSGDGRTWIEAPERVPRIDESVPISVRLPKRMLTILREIARRQNVGYQVLMKRWLADRIRAEFDRRSKASGASFVREAEAEYVASATASPMEVNVGTTVPFAGADGRGAFAHLFVVNKGPFAPRVQCWIHFERLDGSPLFRNEMQARWSCAPEPIRQLVLPRKDAIELVFVPDASLLPVQHVADFASLEGHAIAVAVVHPDGSCWGFTPQSYFHQFRAPEWRLPSERIRVRARVLVNGKQVLKEFELDCSAPMTRFGLTSSEAPSMQAIPIAEAAPTLPADPSALH